MAKRMDAVWRILAFLWAFVAAFVVSLVAIVAIVWGAIDVLWQLVLGSDGLSSSSSPARLIRRTIMWPVNLQLYAFLGEGSFQLLP